jgi:hypothetical protein
VGWPHLPTAVPAKTDSSYRPSTASGARIRSVQVKRRWIIGSVAPPHTTAPIKTVPCAQSTSLTYKRSLTPAGLNTALELLISILLFTYSRISVAWELEPSRASLRVPEEFIQCSVTAIAGLPLLYSRVHRVVHDRFRPNVQL